MRTTDRPTPVGGVDWADRDRSVRVGETARGMPWGWPKEAGRIRVWIAANSELHPFV
jgi:hypothetical protein